MLSGVTAIDHVNIVVSDLEGMVDFYAHVLGLRVTNRGVIAGGWVDAVVGLTDVEAEFVFLDPPLGPRVELLHYRRPSENPAARLGRANLPGLRHIAFKVSSIEAVLEGLRGAGVEFVSEVQMVPATQLEIAPEIRKLLVYFHDPEGNLLELCEYRPAATISDKDGQDTSRAS
ncbi:MAG TPA: VOC family protein [Candidatus Dormibacteraeota bacterium]|nr:VOC family protein [Candidatus Dormibacteraeota bacterium]